MRSALPSPWVTQWRVIKALVLRDVRTRFFGHGLGYLVAIAWPLVHIAIIVLLFTLAGRAPPVGDSLVLFFATGLVPFMLFNYMSRFTMLSGAVNKPLLAFPIVKLLDLLIARGLLETIAACLCSVIVLFVLWLLDIPIWPVDPVQAFCAMGAMLLMGLGFGFTNGVIAVIQPLWVTVYVLFLIVLYIASGIVYVPSMLPDAIRNILWYNPAVHGIEWMRVAYLPGYPTEFLNRGYLLVWGVGSLAFSLVLERSLRRFISSL